MEAEELEKSKRDEAHLKVEEDQYRKINELTTKLAQLTGTVEAQNAINADLVALLKKALLYLFLIVIALIGTVIYGAIGKDGFYAVRKGVVNVTMSDIVPADDKNRLDLCTVQG